MFVISKLLSAITQPLFWLGLWWLVALLLLGRRYRVAVRMLWAGLLVFGLLGFQAFPDALLRPLEARYPVPDLGSQRFAGMIVLGGATGHSGIYQAHGQVPLNQAAERFTVPVGLMHHNPHLRLVFSGGEGRLLKTGITEAALAQQFYEEQGVDMARVRLEDGARNTRENALKVAGLLGTECRQPWLLVTSAWHMPRSMAEFEATGCNVVPYPVDFLTGSSTPFTEYSMAHSVVRWQIALHEWLGRLVYGVTR